MALPSSGQISFYDCFVEFGGEDKGGCLQAESETNIYMSNLWLAQVPSYLYGSIIYMRYS
jgi:hypothetical protein